MASQHWTDVATKQEIFLMRRIIRDLEQASWVRKGIRMVWNE